MIIYVQPDGQAYEIDQLHEFAIKVNVVYDSGLIPRLRFAIAGFIEFGRALVRLVSQIFRDLNEIFQGLKGIWDEIHNAAAEKKLNYREWLQTRHQVKQERHQMKSYFKNQNNFKKPTDVKRFSFARGRI